jgi:hypothetical protein
MRYHRSRSVNSATVSQGGKEGGDTGEHPARPVPLTVRAADRHSGASGMVGLSTNRLQQQGATGDRLAVMVGTMRAMIRQRVKSQPQWFLNSSKLFSQSPRSR